MSRVWIWIGMSLPTLGLSCSLMSALVEIAPREISGQFIPGSGFFLLPMWCIGSLLIAGVMYLIGRALIRMGMAKDKNKKVPPHPFSS